MSDLNFDPFNLPKDVLAAIGLITSCSSQTEHIVEEAIAGLLGVDVEYGFAVTTHMTGPHRDNVLRAAAEIRLDSVHDLDELDLILDEIKAATAKRNIYVHNSIGVEDDTGQIVSARTEARGSVSVELIPVKVEDIISEAKRIHQSGLILLKFLSSRKLLPLLPPEPRPRAHKLKAARKARRKDELSGG